MNETIQPKRKIDGQVAELKEILKDKATDEARHFDNILRQHLEYGGDNTEVSKARAFKNGYEHAIRDALDLICALDA